MDAETPKEKSVLGKEGDSERAITIVNSINHICRLSTRMRFNRKMG